jgi:predicted RNase H-like nuclease
VRVAGVDGCRGGWLVVTTSVDGAEPTVVELVVAVADVVARLRSGELSALGVDMPIGLPASGRRAADRAARAMLGARRSSLFPTPPSAVLEAVDYADALARCRAVDGVGLSMQAYNLLPKMRELAAATSSDLQPALAEVHPETSFAALGGAPCAHSKRTSAGVAERIRLLRPHFGEVVDAALAARPRGALADDVLDAFAATWTARRMALGIATWLGDTTARDPRGMHLTIAV